MIDADPTVMFMGTPEFARVQLAALCDAGYDVKAVVTQPDKPKGRGRHLSVSPVKQYALDKGLAVYQPNTLRGEDFAGLLAETAPELIVVAAYGKILPDNVLAYPKYGCVNVHGSLLPKYRGAAPIQRAIMNGEKTTGVTTMLMDSGVDTGDMLLWKETEITPDDDYGSLAMKLAGIGAELLIETLRGVVSGSLKPVKQDPSKATYASKIEKSDCALDFSLSSEELVNRIRALSPEPLAVSSLRGNQIKIAAAESSDMISEAAPGTVISVRSGVTVACGGGALRITELIPSGKSRMTAAAFVNGRQCGEGDVFGD